MSGIEMLRKAVRLFDGCTESFNAEFTPEQLLKLFEAWDKSDRDEYPDEWPLGRKRAAIGAKTSWREVVFLESGEYALASSRMVDLARFKIGGPTTLVYLDGPFACENDAARMRRLGPDATHTLAVHEIEWTGFAEALEGKGEIFGYVHGSVRAWCASCFEEAEYREANRLGREGEPGWGTTQIECSACYREIIVKE